MAATWESVCATIRHDDEGDGECEENLENREVADYLHLRLRWSHVAAGPQSPFSKDPVLRKRSQSSKVSPDNMMKVWVRWRTLKAVMPSELRIFDPYDAVVRLIESETMAAVAREHGEVDARDRERLVEGSVAELLTAVPRPPSDRDGCVAGCSRVRPDHWAGRA